MTTATLIVTCWKMKYSISYGAERHRPVKVDWLEVYGWVTIVSAIAYFGGHIALWALKHIL